MARGAIVGLAGASLVLVSARFVQPAIISHLFAFALGVVYATTLRRDGANQKASSPLREKLVGCIERKQGEAGLCLPRRRFKARL